jgi:glutaredoxin
MATFELYGSAGCPYTAEMRDWLEWSRLEFTEYDVEADEAARRRLWELSSGQRTVPVLVKDGKVSQVGWQGRGCVISEK